MPKRDSTYKSKLLTDLVLNYQETKDPQLLLSIISKSQGLIYTVYRYYGMLKFPNVLLDDIKEDCNSFILLKTIDAFNRNRKTEFSTFYTWRLKSHIQNRKNYFLRRKDILVNHISLDKALSENSSRDLHNIITNSEYSYRSLREFKKNLANIFNLV